jgi:hypothetical protein
MVINWTTLKFKTMIGGRPCEEVGTASYRLEENIREHHIRQRNFKTQQEKSGNPPGKMGKRQEQAFH